MSHERKEKSGAYLDGVERDGFSSSVTGLHETFEVHVEELEDQVELLVCMDNVEQPVRAWMWASVSRVLEEICPLDNVVILELLEETDLADSGGRDALVFSLEPDLLERNNLVGRHVPGLVDHAVGPCAKMMTM